MITDALVTELEEIINNGLEHSLMPYAKGRSIRIKNYVIRENSKGFLVYDIKANRQVSKTQFKSTAVAIAKTLASGQDLVSTIMRYDQSLTKHYNDAVFYKHSIKNSNDRGQQEVRKIRLEIALEQTASIRDKIDHFIFDN